MSNGSVQGFEDNGAVVPSKAEFSAADSWNLFRRNWHILLVCTCLGVLLAVVYFRFARRIYESATQVLVMRKNPQLVTTAGQAAPDGESKVGEDLLSTHVQLIQSNRLVGEALAKDGLGDLPSIQENLGRHKTAVEYVVHNLSVTRGGSGQAKSAHVINIKFRHASDVDAQRVLMALVDRYQGFLREKFQDVNKEAAELISEAREELEKELVDAEGRYLESRRDAPLLWDGEKSTNVPRRRFEGIQMELSNLQLKYSQVVSRLEVVESTLLELKASDDATGLDWLAVIDEKDAVRLGAFSAVFQGESATAAFQSLQPARATTAQAEGDQLLRLMTKDKTLLNEFGDNHPEVISTREQIRVIREFLDQAGEKTRVNANDKLAMLEPERIVDSYVKLLRHDRKSLEWQIKELTNQAAGEEAAAKKLVDYELEDETIRKEVKRKQELFDAVVNRLRDINLARDYGGFINEVISPPEIGEKVFPKLSILLIFGTMGGLAVGGIFAGIAEFRDRSFRNPDDVAAAVGLPILSQVPDLLLNSKKRKLSSPLSATLCTVHRPKSRDAEVFRSLRTALFPKFSSEKIKIIGCSSSIQGDGKSTIIANLAVSIAQTGRRILLIDCDLRRPRQHELFAIENKHGLTDVLNEDVDFLDAVQETLVPGLSFIPAGLPVNNPAEVLGSPKFSQLLEFVSDRYDLVFVDAPPILAVSDPCIIAPLIDAMLLVIRVSCDSRPQVIQSREMITDVGGKIMGVIINGLNAPSHFFGQYGSRYSAYGYGGYGYGYGYYGATNGKSGSAYHDEESVSETVNVRPQRNGVNGTLPNNHKSDADVEREITKR